MDSISNTVWQRKGSCVIFDKNSLGEFISSGAAISLRQILGWMQSLPAAPPVPGKTILVSGLETVLESLSPEESEDFLVRRIRPLLIELQNRWTGCGIVFGFSAHEKAFRETALEEEVLFRRHDHKEIRLSEGLWDGSATMNMQRIAREDDITGKETRIGYYVSRIS